MYMRMTPVTNDARNAGIAITTAIPKTAADTIAAILYLCPITTSVLLRYHLYRRAVNNIAML